MSAWSALNAAVYASAERALLKRAEKDTSTDGANNEQNVVATTESSVATRGKRNVTLHPKLGGAAVAAGAADRPQRKRNMDGCKIAKYSQPVYLSCLPGAPCERPLLLSPVSDLPDRLAAVSFCPAISNWQEMIGDNILHGDNPTEKKDQTIMSTNLANERANDVQKQSSMAASKIADWEAKRILKYRMQADIIQLKTVLKSFKDIVKDSNRQLSDSSTVESNQSALLQEIAAEYAALARKSWKLREEHELKCKASQAESIEAPRSEVDIQYTQCISEFTLILVANIYF